MKQYNKILFITVIFLNKSNSIQRKSIEDKKAKGSDSDIDELKGMHLA